MQTKWLGVLAIGALVGSYNPRASAAPPDMDDVPLTLSGCVLAGEAKDSYLLTNVVVDGTTMAPPNAFYRFNTTKGLKEYVGRRVEVKGKADLDDVDEAVAGQLRRLSGRAVATNYTKHAFAGTARSGSTRDRIVASPVNDWLASRPQSNTSIRCSFGYTNQRSRTPYLRYQAIRFSMTTTMPSSSARKARKTSCQLY
jgi:hypothetical protein